MYKVGDIVVVVGNKTHHSWKLGDLIILAEEVDNVVYNTLWKGEFLDQGGGKKRYVMGPWVSENCIEYPKCELEDVM